MFFDTWWGLLRVLVVGMLSYAALILLLRLSGNRTLSKLNAFDLVVTVALGSTFASILLTESVALAEGILAMALLIGLQYAVTAVSVRSPTFLNVIKSEPKLLVHEGRLLRQTMKAARVTEEELLAVAREQGIDSLETIDAIVLETDGSFSVLQQLPRPAARSHVTRYGASR